MFWMGVVRRERLWDRRVPAAGGFPAASLLISPANFLSRVSRPGD